MNGIMYCPQCGSKNSEKSRFCSICGAELENFGTRRIKKLLDNRYEIEAVIKSGNMGCVYKARDTRLDISVAVKMMFSHPGNPEDEEYAQKRFIEEAKILSKLHHGGLPKVSDFFVENDPASGRPAHYLIMTFIEGNDLEGIMEKRKKKPLPVEEALGYFRGIMEILSYLHSQSPPVIYRDMKPSNVMIQGDKVFLVDFGIARLFTPQAKGTLIGTPGYASPEQYKGFTDPHSDIYSLGALMHFLLTGIDPQDSATAPFKFDDIQLFNLKVPKYLSDLIMSMLEFKSENRPESADKILETLKDSKSIGSKGAKTSKTGKGTMNKPGKAPEIPKTSEVSKAEEGIDLSKTTVEVQVNDKKKLNDSLLRAVMVRDIGDVKFFLSVGADVNAGDKTGCTPLHLAAWKGYMDLVEILVSRNAYLEAGNFDGDTPLHLAAWTGFKDMVDCLISKGADVNAKNNFGQTPADRARLAGQNGMANYLQSRGGHLNKEKKPDSIVTLPEKAASRTPSYRNQAGKKDDKNTGITFVFAFMFLIIGIFMHGIGARFRTPSDPSVELCGSYCGGFLILICAIIILVLFIKSIFSSTNKNR